MLWRHVFNDASLFRSAGDEERSCSADAGRHDGQRARLQPEEEEEEAAGASDAAERCRSARK